MDIKKYFIVLITIGIIMSFSTSVSAMEVTKSKSLFWDFIPRDSDRPCTDTDGGINLYVKGTATNTFMGSFIQRTDYCIDEKYLMEYTCCAGNRLVYIYGNRFKCSGVCRNGACVDDRIDIPLPLERYK
ncbi:MAG: hypothetical protein KAQ92_05375 [Candidatus Aenigmarchaeota archaeon]|nr:hypothetical protein [Candidatus Aenigmarchaeota archaeon]